MPLARIAVEVERRGVTSGCRCPSDSGDRHQGGTVGVEASLVLTVRLPRGVGWDLITVDVGNNPARCRMLIYHKGLEEQIDLKTPGDFGGTSSASYRALNPQGKIPVLLLPDGTAFFEARVILNYLCEKYADVGPAVGAATAPGSSAYIVW